MAINNKESEEPYIAVPLDQPCDQYKGEIKGLLLDFMKMLHHVFIFPQSERWELQLVSCCDDLDAIVLKDDSLLLHALIALGTGGSAEKMLPKYNTTNPFQRSNFLAFWVASEMIRQGRSRSPGQLQDILQHHMAVYQTPKRVCDALTKLRIAASRERTRLQDIAAVNKKITDGWDLKNKKHWMAFIMYDNLGFRIRGARAGYDQYTMIITSFIGPKELQRVGFYLPVGSDKPPISRQRKQWDVERNNILKEDILPKEDNYVVLGLQVLALIDWVLSIVNKIPTLDKARQQLDTGDVFIADMRISLSYGAKVRASLGQTSNEVEVMSEESDDGDLVENLGSTATMYNRHNQTVNVDLPVRADLNKKKL